MSDFERECNNCYCWYDSDKMINHNGNVFCSKSCKDEYYLEILNNG